MKDPGGSKAGPGKSRKWIFGKRRNDKIMFVRSLWKIGCNGQVKGLSREESVPPTPNALGAGTPLINALYVGGEVHVIPQRLYSLVAVYLSALFLFPRKQEAA